MESQAIHKTKNIKPRKKPKTAVKWLIFENKSHVGKQMGANQVTEVR